MISSSTATHFQGFRNVLFSTQLKSILNNNSKLKSLVLPRGSIFPDASRHACRRVVCSNNSTSSSRGSSSVSSSQSAEIRVPNNARGISLEFDNDDNYRPEDTPAAEVGGLGIPLTSTGKVLLKALTFKQLEDWVHILGERPSRAKQTWGWMYNENKWAKGPEEMQEVSKSWKDKLAEVAEFNGRIYLKAENAASDGTRKLLFDVANPTTGVLTGSVVEAVLIPAPSGRLTVCISSQVGCAMNCQFCFTGRMGLLANLTTDQIVDQVVEAKRVALRTGMGKVTNVVFMGMGEPLHNLHPVMNAVEVLVSPAGLALSPNKVSVSTSGLVPQMRQFCTASPASLAVSINATTDEVRNWLMPINRKYNLATLIGFLEEQYPAGGSPKSRVFLEYIMLKDINDSNEDADRLTHLTRNLNCKVNLIHFNAHAGSEFSSSALPRVLEFRDRLADQGVLVTIRESRGDEASAACGQLGSAEGPPADATAPSRKPPRLKPPKSLRAAVDEMRSQRPVTI